MAPPSKRHQSWEKFDERRLIEAVREISASKNLRFFFRSLLGEAGVQSILPSDNALATARAAGKHELGLSILATFALYQPALWPTMLLEEVNELSERASPAPISGTDRGFPGPGDDDYPARNDTTY